MKNRYKTNLKLTRCVCLFLFFNVQVIFSQVSNFGDIYVVNGGIFYTDYQVINSGRIVLNNAVFNINSGNYIAVNSGRVSAVNGGNFNINSGDFLFSSQDDGTSRDANTYGFFSFGNTATSSNASDLSHVDGYVRYTGDSNFTFPVGFNGKYAPVAIDPTSSQVVDVAYFASYNIAGATNLSAGIQSNFSDVWHIKSVNTSGKITLTWNNSLAAPWFNSNLQDLLLTPSLAYLTIIGYNGTQWVEIPSFFDTTSLFNSPSTVNSGSITSLENITLSDYQYYSIGVKPIASCYPTQTPSGNVVTWNGGSWTPNVPTLRDDVVIDQPYNSGSFSAYSVTLNSDLTLNDGETLDVTDSFYGTGKIIMSSEASVLQRNDLGLPPKISISKVTNPMRRFDYVFLSSPLNNFSSFFNQLTSPANCAVNGQFNTYNNSAFYNYFTDNDLGNSVAVTSNNVALGRGFAATVSPIQPPYTVNGNAGSWFDERYPIHIKAEGTSNNGSISVPMPTSVGWVRIGNPYPSPINANKLLDQLGEDVRKTVYYWTFNTPRQNWNNNSSNYNNADYATFNYSGGVAACGGCEIPNGMIATMQSVYVRKINPNPITFTMTNCMRDLSGNDLFYRNNITDKFRINLQTSTGAFSQLLIAYNPSTQNGYDNGYDSPRMSSGLTSEINSLIDGQTNGYAIQTRGAFSETDIVPLQVIKRAEESFTIYLSSREGVFVDGTKIYLHDKTLNIYHPLDSSPYTFVASTSVDNNRFEIVYQRNTLSNDDLNTEGVFAYINDGLFNAQAKSSISEIQIYDLTGRLIQFFPNINNDFLSKPFHFPQSVYVAKIKLDNGLIVSQKVINQ